jgi:tyrosine decarboxylase/aspartate 1-decarboxylase
MRDKGCREEELFSYLSSRKSEDLECTHILSSMCTVPHPVAIRAHQMFIGTNLGDPGLFPGTAGLEQRLIEELARLFHHPGACGYATSGGTESNIQALRLAKSRGKKPCPNVVLPESAHFSFKKACDILSLEMRTVSLDENYRVDLGQAEEAIDEQTCCVVGIAGTTEYGMVDPIPELADLAAENDIFFHVDAAFGGMVLPFLDHAVPFDFSLPGVSSIAVDPHKMGMGTIPSGCLLVRDPGIICELSVDTPYLTVKREFTLSGTRPGAPVVAALAVLEFLGREGMQAVVEGCMKNTRRLISGMETFGIHRVVTPDVNVATFDTNMAIPPPWQVSRTRQGHLRIVCMPHVHAGIIEEFLRDIGESIAG